MSDMALELAANAKEMSGIQQLGPRLKPTGIQPALQFGCCYSYVVTLAPIPSDPQPKMPQYSLLGVQASFTPYHANGLCM